MAQYKVSVAGWAYSNSGTMEWLGALVAVTSKAITIGFSALNGVRHVLVRRG